MFQALIGMTFSAFFPTQFPAGAYLATTYTLFIPFLVSFAIPIPTFRDPFQTTCVK